MNGSQKDKIRQFQATTECRNWEYTIQFLNMYAWHLDFAIDAYMEMQDKEKENYNEPIFIDSHQINSNKIESLSQLSTGYAIEKLTLDTNSSEGQTEHDPSMQLSSHLHNSLQQRETDNDSDQTSTKKSFVQHAEEKFVPNITKNPFTFLDANQFDSQQWIEYIDTNIIGKYHKIKTPWGILTLKYADYTASGRSLEFIERAISHNVLPYYGNTHSENNICAAQTTKFRESARKHIKECVNATEEDVLIFVGTGSTGAINKLVDVLGLKNETIHNKMVVLISAFEHHSNILPWKETRVELVRIPNTKYGLIDEDFLQEQLHHYHYVMKKQIICTFSAASNITGIQNDVDRISTLIHQYNGWSFWDYAAGAPYMKIDMNTSETAYKDAIFISPHKFIGGPGTPGILLAKQKLFTNKIPCDCGGGTVNYVTRTRVEYIKDIETREEGGTPNIIGAIRAGLVFRLKKTVGERFIEDREDELVKKCFDRFGSHEKLLILGSTKPRRLAIFSFLIYVPIFKKYLHHHFICVLLNDLFGIQVRSGCSCAGPYVLDLLNIPDELADIYMKFLTQDPNNQDEFIPRNELMRPGFTRLNFPYFESNTEIDYILNALEFIAEEGWKFLSLMKWEVRDAPLQNHSSELHSLQMITFRNGLMEENMHIEQHSLMNNLDIMVPSSDDPIEVAKSIANSIPKYVHKNLDFRSESSLDIPDEYQDFIWFIIPRQVVLQITVDYENNRLNNGPPFHPRLNNQLENRRTTN